MPSLHLRKLVKELYNMYLTIEALNEYTAYVDEINHDDILYVLQSGSMDVAAMSRLSQKKIKLLQAKVSTSDKIDIITIISKPARTTHNLDHILRHIDELLQSYPTLPVTKNLTATMVRETLRDYKEHHLKVCLLLETYKDEVHIRTKRSMRISV